MTFPCNDRTDEDNTIFILWPFWRWKKQQQQQNWVFFSKSASAHKTSFEGHLHWTKTKVTEEKVSLKMRHFFVLITQRSGTNLTTLISQDKLTCVWECLTLKKFTIVETIVKFNRYFLFALVLEALTSHNLKDLKEPLNRMPGHHKKIRQRVLL